MTRALVTTITAIVAVCVLMIDDAWAHPAWGIVVDRQGQVYFSDLETVWKIDAQGKLTIFRAGMSGRHIHELAIDENGNLYGPDYSYVNETQGYINAIWKMTPAGEFTYILAPTDNLPRGMSILKDRDGNMYSVEQNNHLKRETLLLKRTPSGNVTVLAGSSYGQMDGKGSQAKFRSIVGMAFGPDGSLYMADSTSVRKVTMDGAVTTLASDLDAKDPDKNRVNEEMAWGSLMGLSVNAQGDVYVADLRNRRVLKVSRDGALSTITRAEPPWSPTGVAVAGSGDLYIMEVGFTPPGTWIKPRVRRMSSDGRVTTIATVMEENGRPASESSTVESSAGGNSKRTTPFSAAAPYALVGVAICLFALTIVIWRVRRKRSVH